MIATVRVTSISESDVKRLAFVVRLAAVDRLRGCGVTPEQMSAAIEDGRDLAAQILELGGQAPHGDYLLDAFATLDVLRWRLREGL